MEEQSMKALLEDYDAPDRIEVGDVVEGVVLSANDKEVMVNIHYHADGVLPKEEIPDANPEAYEEGQTLQVCVTALNDGEGNVMLSLNKAYDRVVWDEFQNLSDEALSFDVRITEAVKGGIVGTYKGARVFIPASHVSMRYTEDLKAYVGQTLSVKIIDYTKSEKRVVASAKAVEQAEREVQKQALLQSLKKGDRLEGTVARLADFGAFVDLGGLDGLVHISRMSWRRVQHPSEVVAQGDAVKVEVVGVDAEKGKVSLKLLDTGGNPWDTVKDRYPVGESFSGTVTNLAPFGAFVMLEEGIEGLVHISELSDTHVKTPSEVVSEGQEVVVKILSIDFKTHRISLSMKTDSEPAERDFEAYIEKSEGPQATLSDVFGDLLSKFKE